MAQQTEQAPRIGPEDLKARMQASETVTVLDARAADAWNASNQKVKGDIRVDPKQFRPDPSWPKERLTVVY